MFQHNLYFRVVIRRQPETEAPATGKAGTPAEKGTAAGTARHRAPEKSMQLSRILQWEKGAPLRREQYIQWKEARRGRLFREELEETVRTVQAQQTDETLNFLVMTDNHYTVNGTWEDTASNLRRVTEELRAEGVELDGFIHLGDATDGMVPGEVTRDYVGAMQEDIAALEMPFYYVLGNHDSNYFRGNPDRFSGEQMRELYLPGRERNYYEQDLESRRLRMFFLDSFDPGENVRYGFSDQELDWLEGRLEQTPPDWHVLVYSHVPPTPRLHYWSKEIRGSRRLLRILKRYQIRTRELTGGEGNLLGFIHGHNHADQTDYEEGFPIISVGCGKCEYFEDKKPSGSVTWERERDSVSQELWDVLVVSVKNETLDFVRFGAGENRHISNNAYKDRRIEIPMKKVITYGTFDLFHEGHYNILKRAKALGDYLIVGVTTEYYDEQRGKLNIVDSLLERIENVRETGLVDQIIIEDHEGQKIEDAQKYGVDIFTVGSDWVGVFDYLKAYCQVVYLERTPDISSTMLRKGKFPIIRMGVVGSGRIAPRFVAEAKFVSGLNVQSVYNPHKEAAGKFGTEHFLDAYSDSFEEFLESVDAIYIATPHETHYDYTRRALAAGKHVLCEKPMAFTVELTKELFDLAKKKNLVLMEGIKTAYCPGFAQMINIAKSGKIGEIKDVEACFSRLTPPYMREMMDTRYGGAFLEFGSYTMLPIIKLLGAQYENVKVSSILAENGVDLYTKIYFDYPGGMATSKTGLGVKSEGQLLISGTKGYILAESPWWLTRKFQVRYEDPTQIETYSPKFLGDGLRYEISEFASRINGRGTHNFRLTEEESIAMAEVVERFMEERHLQRARMKEKNRASGVKIWAHRGCSYRFPENTLEAFGAACEVPGLAGIELDIQLTRDGQLVVFHDETVNRLMDASGNVRDYTLEELKAMRFKDWVRLQNKEESPTRAMPRIPAMAEVLELVRPYARKYGVQINIELKNSIVAYEGMEEKILALVKEYGMEENVVYSSFNGESVKKLKMLDQGVRTGILQPGIGDCLRLFAQTGADDLHPGVDSMLEDSAAGLKLPEGARVRAWNGREPLYGQVRQYVVFDLGKMKKNGVTDFITNVPEEYLGEQDD